MWDVSITHYSWIAYCTLLLLLRIKAQSSCGIIFLTSSSGGTEIDNFIPNFVGIFDMNLQIEMRLETTWYAGCKHLKISWTTRHSLAFMKVETYKRWRIKFHVSKGVVAWCKNFAVISALFTKETVTSPKVSARIKGKNWYIRWKSRVLKVG